MHTIKPDGEFSLSQLREIGGVGEKRLLKWIGQRLFVPQLIAVTGARRSYSLHDAMVLAAAVRLMNGQVWIVSRRAAFVHAAKIRVAAGGDTLVVAYWDAAVMLKIDTPEYYDRRSRTYGAVFPAERDFSIWGVRAMGKAINVLSIDEIRERVLMVNSSIEDDNASDDVRPL